MPKDISSLVDSIKSFKPFFLNEFIEELNKNKDIQALTLQEIEARGSELTDKLFLNEFANQKEIISELINFSEGLIKFLYKFNYYDSNTHKLSQDENKVYQLKKLDFLRNIFENINFEQLSNAEFLRILPCIIVLERIFNFSSLISNSFNTAINRLLASNSFYLCENSEKNILDEKVFSIKKNNQLLKDFIKYTFLNYGNFTNLNNSNNDNFSNAVFVNFEALLGKLVYLKDIIVENSDINEIMFLLTENILHFNYSLLELEKINKSNKKNLKAKTKDFVNLFQDFLNSYLNYAVMLTSQQPNSIKNIDTNLLKKFTSAIILLKKAETEFPDSNDLKNDKKYSENLKEFVEEFLFKIVFSKQSILSNFITKGDGMLNLIELDSLFEVNNFDAKISANVMQEYCADRVAMKDSSALEFLRFAAGKYQATNINKL